MKNRSPKGNMWSAIPVALLCMIVNCSEGKQPKTEDFRSEGARGGTNKRTNGQTNESPPVFYRTLSPSGPLPCSPSLQFTITQRRATGITDHILPLGDLFFIVPDVPPLEAEIWAWRLGGGGVRRRRIRKKFPICVEA